MSLQYLPLLALVPCIGGQNLWPQPLSGPPAQNWSTESAGSNSTNLLAAEKEAARTDDALEKAAGQSNEDWQLSQENNGAGSFEMDKGNQAAKSISNDYAKRTQRTSKIFEKSWTERYLDNALEKPPNDVARSRSMAIQHGDAEPWTEDERRKLAMGEIFAKADKSAKSDPPVLTPAATPDPTDARKRREIAIRNKLAADIEKMKITKERELQQARNAPPQIKDVYSDFNDVPALQNLHANNSVHQSVTNKTSVLPASVAALAASMASAASAASAKSTKQDETPNASVQWLQDFLKGRPQFETNQASWVPVMPGLRLAYAI